MAKQLQAEGYAVGRAKARRLMKAAGVRVRRAKHRRPMTPDSRHGYGVAPNLLARQFDVAKPDQVWAGDIPYVWTAEGWLYVAVLFDLYSRKVVDYIEMFYNSRRKHSYLGYVGPNEYEALLRWLNSVSVFP